MYKKIFIILIILFGFVGQVFAGDPWTVREDAGLRNWSAADSSSDGTKAVIIVNNGYIYTSTDSGVTWTERTGAGARDWRNVVMSADGTKIMVSVFGGYIYTSENGGVDWTERTSAGSRNWRGVAAASDWSRLIALDYFGYIYTSSDGGANWTQQTNSGAEAWGSIASSDDGMNLIVGELSGGYVFTSTDGGVNWATTTDLGTGNWSAVTSSSDGSKLAIINSSNGYVYTSTDSGANWTAITSLGTGYWSNIRSSSDGTKIVLSSNNGATGSVYLSQDGGTTWVEQTSIGNKRWSGMAVSSDFTKIIVGALGNYIYTYMLFPPSVGTPVVSATAKDFVVLDGEITNTGGENATERGFVYGLTSTYTATFSVSGDFSEESFSQPITDLSCGTTYHYAVYASNSIGTTYGSDSTFNTGDCLVKRVGKRDDSQIVNTDDSTHTRIYEVLSSLTLIITDIQTSESLTTDQKKEILSLILRILERVSLAL